MIISSSQKNFGGSGIFPSPGGRRTESASNYIP